MTDEQREQFRKALAAARQRRQELIVERDLIQHELMQQSRAITALAELLGDPPVLDIGLTAATTIVIATARTPLAPTEVRDELKRMGHDIDSYSNPMATLHQVLRRLEEHGVIGIVYDSDGKKRFVDKGFGLPASRATTAPYLPGQNLGVYYRGMEYATVKAVTKGTKGPEYIKVVVPNKKPHR